VIDGFVIAFLHDVPPVYDPGGRTCTIDDFTVASPHLWPSVGRDLLLAAADAIRELGAAQIVVVCGHHDEPKRAMLEAAGWPVASEWRVRAL
jgi:GNAT superfamily N-acetyltransferase